VDEGGRIALVDHLREPRVLAEWLGGRRAAISPGVSTVSGGD